MCLRKMAATKKKVIKVSDSSDENYDKIDSHFFLSL